jgi:E3 ubiquitin-protein ligase SHPRH
LYTKENAWGTISVSAFAQENDQAVDEVAREKRSGKDNKNRGDFIYKVDDMLAILFPHMFEEVEYLLPTASVAPDTQDVEMRDVFEGANHEAPRRVAGSEGNAVAGPSRLR